MVGVVDAYSLISFKVYVSFMSGNTTQAGSQIGQGNLSAATPALQALGFFVVGLFLGSWLALSGSNYTRRLLYGLVAALLAVNIGLTELASEANVVGIATLSVAMAFMNVTLTHISGQAVNLVVVTGTLITMARHLALAVKRAPLPDAQGSWDTQLRRAAILASLWAALLIGALLSGVANSRFGVWVLLPPAVILLALAVFSRGESASAKSSA
jgi:uncharacterized membrane protein YoaK (UPF0700 family)